MKYLAMLIALALPVANSNGALAQAQSSGSAFSPAKSIGMFAYPKNKQDSDQQLKDEGECYTSAKQNTQFDPQAPPAAAPSEQSQQAAQQQAAEQ
jgi:hypothetical protein